MTDQDRVFRQYEVFLKENSRVKWLAEGIEIPPSFALYLKRMSLFSMQIGDDIIYDPDRIGEHVVSYYQRIFADPSDSNLDLSMFGRMFLTWSLQRRMLSSSVFLLMMR